MGRLSGKGGGRIASANSADISTIQGLTRLGKLKGLSKEVSDIVNKKPKLSILQRLGAGLGAFNPAEAFLTGKERGTGQGVLEYGKDIVTGIGSAITGNDYQGQRRYFKDVAEIYGTKNGIAKFGIGFIGDVLLDPTTYFGGAIARGLLKGATATGSRALSTVGRVAPDVETGLRLAGKGAKDALGNAFVYGYGTSKGLSNRALDFQSKVSKAKEGIVQSNIQRLGTGTLSPSQQEELVSKLLAGKRAEFRGTTTDISSGDSLVQKTITEQSARSQKFAKQAGIQDPFEVYFPGLKIDKLKNFFDSSKILRVGSEGYRKQFKDLLIDKEMVRNPAEAFATREFQVVKDNLVRSELKNSIKDFGKPLNAFKNEEEASTAGYKLIKEKGIFGKPVGYLQENDKKFIDNLISPEFTTIDAIAKSTGFDAITSLFKRSVTGLFAPFHVRNFASGMVQNFETLGIDALNPKNIAAGQKLAWKLARGEKFKNTFLNVGGKDLNVKKAFDAFKNRFGTSSSYIADIADATRGAGISPGKLIGKESLKTTLKTGGLGQEAIPFRAARAVGNFIETQQKATAYITALNQGKTIDEALNLATSAGFDYRALTSLESKVLRRIIPFYSFTRKNIELQLHTLKESPQRINQIIALLQNAQGNISPEERAGLPDYAKEQFVLKTGETVKAKPEIAVGLGTPIEALSTLFSNNPIQRIASTINPLFKVPLERAFNRDFFRDRPLNEVIEATEYKNAPQFIKDFLNVKEVVRKSKSGEKKISYNADPERLQILRNLPTTRGAVYLNAIFDNQTTSESKVLNAFTGIKPKPIDLETIKYFKDRDNRRELEDMLIRAGVLKQFEKTYVPK